MSLNAELQPPTEWSYFMPHHYVLNEEKETTKLDVVFDASTPTLTGVGIF